MIRCNRSRCWALPLAVAVLTIAAGPLGFAAAAFARPPAAQARDKAEKAKEKKNTSDAKLVDSGSFGIYVNGRRVATETFEIHQTAGGSSTTSKLKVEDGSTQIGQVTELLLDSAGNLQRYKWSETSPGKASAIVEPRDQLLVQNIYTSPNEKPYEQPFLLAPSTVILDDYFFVHRQLLAWRYLGTGCRTQEGTLECSLPKTQYPVLVPRQHISTLVSLEFLGKDRVELRGKQRELQRFRLELEDSNWLLWLDDAHHLQRILISSQSTEVVRD